MAAQWVIKNDNTGYFLTGWNEDPQLCMWGNEENAITYQTEAAAQTEADRYQSGGFIHPIHQNPH